MHCISGQIPTILLILIEHEWFISVFYTLQSIKVRLNKRYNKFHLYEHFTVIYFPNLNFDTINETRITSYKSHNTNSPDSFAC